MMNLARQCGAARPAVMPALRPALLPLHQQARSIYLTGGGGGYKKHMDEMRAAKHGTRPDRKAAVYDGKKAGDRKDRAPWQAKNQSDPYATYNERVWESNAPHAFDPSEMPPTGREHIKPDSGNKTFGMAIEYSHLISPEENQTGPYSKQVTERGRVWTAEFNNAIHTAQSYNYLDQSDIPPHVRNMVIQWGSHDRNMQLEWVFFWFPFFIVFGSCMPGFAGIYALDDNIYCDMVVKVTGRQWYWVYEVESPTDDSGEAEEDEEEDDDDE